MTLPTWLRRLTPAEILARQLANAEVSRVQYAASAEEHRHYISMLDARIARIRKELQAITNPATEEEK